MTSRSILVLIAAMSAIAVTPAAAQVLMAPADARLQTLRYHPGTLMHLVGFPDAELTFLFAPGERVSHVAAATTDTEPMASTGLSASIYRLKGDRIVLPLKIGDDSAKTYIEWHPDQSLPAVFGIGSSGQEEVVAGYMRGATFVIDRVYAKLVFRFDKARAEARREVPRD